MYSGTANVGNTPLVGGATGFGSGTATNIALGNYLVAAPVFTNEIVLPQGRKAHLDPAAIGTRGRAAHKPSADEPVHNEADRAVVLELEAPGELPERYAPRARASL